MMAFIMKIDNSDSKTVWGIRGDESWQVFQVVSSHSARQNLSLHILYRHLYSTTI